MRFSVTSNSRVRFSVECAFPHLGKRGAGSRKSALCNLRLTEKRTLARAHRAHLTEKCTLLAWGGRRVRLSVTSPPEGRGAQPPARLRGVAPGSANLGLGLTSRKGALCPSFSPKGAFWPDRLTQSRTLRFSDRTDCAFLSHRGAREVWGNPPASLRGTMENASTGQTRSSNPPPACGGVAPGPASLGLGSGCTEGRSLGRGPR